MGCSGFASQEVDVDEEHDEGDEEYTRDNAGERDYCEKKKRTRRGVGRIHKKKAIFSIIVHGSANQSRKPNHLASPLLLGGASARLTGRNVCRSVHVRRRAGCNKGVEGFSAGDGIWYSMVQGRLLYGFQLSVQ